MLPALLQLLPFFRRSSMTTLYDRLLQTYVYLRSRRIQTLFLTCTLRVTHLSLFLYLELFLPLIFRTRLWFRWYLSITLCSTPGAPIISSVIVPFFPTMLIRPFLLALQTVGLWKLWELGMSSLSTRIETDMLPSRSRYVAVF